MKPLAVKAKRMAAAETEATAHADTFFLSGGQGLEEYGIWLVVEVGTQYWLYPGSAVPYNCVL